VVVNAGWCIRGKACRCRRHITVDTWHSSVLVFCLSGSTAALCVVPQSRAIERHVTLRANRSFQTRRHRVVNDHVPLNRSLKRAMGRAKRSSHWAGLATRGTAGAPQLQPGSRSRFRRSGGRLVAFHSEPGRGRRHSVTFELAVLATQSPHASHSTLVKTSLPGTGLPMSAAAYPVHVEMLWALQSNLRASCVGKRPACVSSTIGRGTPPVTEAPNLA
jgi:hypothetical protein